MTNSEMNYVRMVRALVTLFYNNPTVWAAFTKLATNIGLFQANETSIENLATVLLGNSKGISANKANAKVALIAIDEKVGAQVLNLADDRGDMVLYEAVNFGSALKVGE